MKLKVCGMKFPKNIKEVADLKPDYMGFIFYPKSARHASLNEIQKSIKGLPADIEKVGVFVNHQLSEVLNLCQKLQLDYVQLHGNETTKYLAKIKNSGIRIIQVFHLDNSFEWDQIIEFSSLSDFFLFDTSTPHYGGSGQKFDWDILKSYTDDTPFFLSGGIDVADIPAIKKLNHPQLWGIDVNSRMEISPGLKDISKIQLLINEMKK